MINIDYRSRFTLLFILGFFIYIFWNCTERHRTNPFDPKGESPSVLNVRLLPMENRVRVEWSLTRPVEGIRAYRLYRGEDSPKNMELLAEISPNRMTFTDTSVVQGRWYYYKVSALGKSTESPPSAVRKTLLGRGSTWVLSKYDGRVKKLSYDLQHVLADYPVYNRPESWAFNNSDSIIWMNFRFIDRGLIKLNKHTGSFQTYYINDLLNPIDIAYDSRIRRLYILDNEDHSIFVFNGNYFVDSIAIDNNILYTQIELAPMQQQLYVLGDTRLLIVELNPTFEIGASIPFPENQIGVDLKLVGNRAYVLTTSPENQQSMIFTVSPLAEVMDTLAYEGILYRLGFDWVNDLLYAAEFRETGGDFIVQLSLDGVRQFQVSGFRDVEFIGINPFDRTVVICDGLADNLVLMDPNGNIISQSKQADETVFLEGPIRVFIE